MADFIMRLYYLFTNGLIVVIMACVVSKELVLPILGIWILTEIDMLAHKLEHKDKIDILINKGQLPVVSKPD